MPPEDNPADDVQDIDAMKMFYLEADNKALRKVAGKLADELFAAAASRHTNGNAHHFAKADWRECPVDECKRRSAAIAAYERLEKK